MESANDGEGTTAPEQLQVAGEWALCDGEDAHGLSAVPPSFKDNGPVNTHMYI